MSKHERASIQMGVAKFLHGETYGSQMMLDPFEEAVRRPVADSVKNLEEYSKIRSHHFVNDAQRQMQEVGGLPEQCLSCAAFDCDLSRVRDHMHMKETFRAKWTCKAKGCDSAREKYIENFQELSKLGRADISIDVSLNAAPIKESRLDASGMSHTVLIRNPDNRIRINPSIDGALGSGRVNVTAGGHERFGTVRDRIDPNDYFTHGESRSYAKETPIRLQEQEIAELLEMELKNDLSHYGEVVW